METTNPPFETPAKEIDNRKSEVFDFTKWVRHKTPSNVGTFVVGSDGVATFGVGVLRALGLIDMRTADYLFDPDYLVIGFQFYRGDEGTYKLSDNNGSKKLSTASFLAALMVDTEYSQSYNLHMSGEVFYFYPKVYSEEGAKVLWKKLKKELLGVR